jgi:hypothetical protein
LGRSKISKATRELFCSLQSALDDASDRLILREDMAAIRTILRTPYVDGYDEIITMGARRNFNRDPQLPHFTRDDGAWFDFAITLREGVVVSYSFEIRFLHGEPPWVRVDLNPPDHNNDQRGMRCHLHVASDDDGMVVPFQDPGPLGVLELLLAGLRRTGRVRTL